MLAVINGEQKIYQWCNDGELSCLVELRSLLGRGGGGEQLLFLLSLLSQTETQTITYFIINRIL